MAHICDCCRTIFDKEIEKLRNEDYVVCCPHKDCGGEIIEIDDLLLPIIERLWDLGYMTEFCCSGHPFRLNFETTIHFNKQYFEEFTVEFPFLPDGFKLMTYNDNSNLITLTSETTDEDRKIKMGMSDIQKLELILNNVKSLSEWIIRLEKWYKEQFEEL